MRRSIRGVRAPLALLALVATVSGVDARPLVTHEMGTVRLSSSQIPMGGSLTLTGAMFTKDAPLTLELRGALTTLPLGQVRTDGNGGFTLTFTLPPEARAGAYSLVVVADDGDVVARAGLVVLATAAPTPDPQGGMGPMPGTAEGRGTPEMMNLPGGPSSQSALILTLLAVCVVAGALMVQRARAAEGGAGNGGMKWSLAAGLIVLAAAGVINQKRPEGADSTSGAMAGMDHASPASPSGADPAGMAGMPGMDHTNITAAAGVDHAAMPGMETGNQSVAPASANAASMDHSSMPGMASPGRPTPAQPMAGMDHAAMAGAGQPPAAAQAPMPGMDHAAMPGMAPVAGAAPQGAETDQAAMEKLRRLAALLVEDELVQALIEADPELRVRWQDERVKASLADPR